MKKRYYTRKVIIAVAPVGRSTQPPAINPRTPKQVADEVIRCARAGASMVHLHVRDAKGVQTEDVTVYSQTLDRIRTSSDIVIQGSTGGLTTLTLEQRCVAVNDKRTEVASLNMGSVNFGEDVYINRLPDIRYWAKRMRQIKTVPEMEIFDSGMLPAARALVAEGAIQPPYSICFCLGFHWTLAPDPKSLFFMTSMMNETVPWGVIHDGMTDFTRARHRHRPGGIPRAGGLRGQHLLGARPGGQAQRRTGAKARPARPPAGARGGDTGRSQGDFGNPQDLNMGMD